MGSLLDRIRRINVWERDGERAPHKPLLLLLALARLQRGEPRLARFVDIEEELDRLLREFGPPRRTSAAYPFWYMTSDGLWVFQGSTYGLAGPSNTPRKGALRDSQATAGLPLEDFEQLRRDRSRLAEVARALLDAHFPPSLHQDVLDSVGLDLDLGGTVGPSARDPAFRRDVLRAYGFRCAVCDLQVLVDGQAQGLEAAHLRWRAAQGPDEVSNGLALCALHHKALDRGWFGIDQATRIRISRVVSGNEAYQSRIGCHDGQPLHRPRDEALQLREAHRAWHWREVFREA